MTGKRCTEMNEEKEKRRYNYLQRMERKATTRKAIQSMARKLDVVVHRSLQATGYKS